MRELQNLGKQEKENSVFLTLLRQALDNKNMHALGAVLMGIQRAVESGGSLHASPMSEYELQQLLQTGKGVIYVGSGTNGQRIFIESGELIMPTGYEVSEKLGRKYQNGFRRIFNLSQDEEMIVSF